MKGSAEDTIVDVVEESVKVIEGLGLPKLLIFVDPSGCSVTVISVVTVWVCSIVSN